MKIQVKVLVEDRDREIESLKEEAELMKGNKGWKVGENVYNSKKWTPPVTHI